MTEGLFSTLDLDSAAPARTGYRLHRLEVFNWGTFDEHVWTVYPRGATSLLTGDIGSGKSTLVDAVTTLLLPAQKISYNKAAGAGSKERSLRSYVEGHYSSQRNETTGASVPVGLRNSGTYSVILGYFYNAGYDESVTLAQVFQQKEQVGQPDRFFVTYDGELTVAEDFSNFGTQLNALRGKLRNIGATIHTTFPDYARRMRRLLGIRSEHAMDLFHQTVSMKSVGNLNDFVRTHMLEPADSSGRIAAIVEHFEHLTKTYEAVQRASAQLKLLDPLMAKVDHYETVAAEHAQLELHRNALAPFLLETTLEVVKHDLAEHTDQLATYQSQLDEGQARRQRLESQQQMLRDARAQEGGARLTELEALIPQAQAALAHAQQRRTVFAEAIASAGLDPVRDPEDFRQRLGVITASITAHNTELQQLKDRRDPVVVQGGEATRRVRKLSADLKALTEKRSNLPADLLDVRTRLATALQCTEDELPFTGELMEVADDYSQWRGAAERVLRPLATTVLVPHRHYAAASEWINATHLGTRFVYLQVPQRDPVSTASTSGATQLRDIIEVEPGEFLHFVREQLAHRADHRLVNTVTALRDHRKAVTIAGLVKAGNRHEKDDRTAIDDPRSWVLGRGVERKIALFTQDLQDAQATVQDLEEQLDTFDATERNLRAQLWAFQRLENFSSWEEIDVASATTQVKSLQTEQERLRSGSSRLAEIERSLADIEQQYEACQVELDALNKHIGRVEDTIHRVRTRADKDLLTLSDIPEAVRTEAAQHYPALHERLGDPSPSTLEACDVAGTQLRNVLVNGLTKTQQEMTRLTSAIEKQMYELVRRWPELGTDMDAHIGARQDFRSLHTRITHDDLPKFEDEFRRQLNVESIRELVQFNGWLNRQAESIKQRVEAINEALAAIDYNPGHIIALTTEGTRNTEVREFQHDLRNATSDVLGDDDSVEARFERVRVLIERFQGREHFAEADKRWTERVTDVRNWFTFAAVEQDRETLEVYEHYTDSDGKSGGQKEKLAYTILAASLSYQFGLKWGQDKSQDFRFVVIDEAFGRGSDASTRYALQLFEKLGLQLLIVTPLQKVHVIEPYVETVGFVDNPTSASSRVHTLTVEEFRQKQAIRKG